jgi:hypothetical protein
MRTIDRSHRRESGVVLMTALIMLVIMTLLVLSMLRTSVIELKIGGVAQTSAQTLANAEAAIWAFMNDANNRDRFTHQAVLDLDLSNDFDFNSAQFKHLASVNLSAREVACVEDASTGRGHTLGRTWELVHFDVQADSGDPDLPGRAIVHQGIRSTVPAGTCLH